MKDKILFLVLGIYLWGGALFQGYLHDLEYLLSSLLIYLLFTFVLISNQRYRVKWFHVAVFLFVICYWFSLLYAVDFEQGFLEAIRVSVLIPISIVSSLIAEKDNKYLYKLYMWISASLVVVGLLFHLERDHRLESTLGYANTLAIFLLVSLCLTILYDANHSRKIHVAMMSIQITGLLLAFSRSVWVFWALSLLCLLIFFPTMRKRPILIKIGVTHLLGFFLAAMMKRDLLFFLHRLKSIDSHASELQIRLTYWKDSLTMIQDHLWNGTGGGGWSLLLPLYRSKNYYVAFVHNHYLQVLLDVGVFGFILFLWIAISFYMQAFRTIHNDNEENTYFTKGIVLSVTFFLLHAGFDFDLSFPFMFAVLISLMGWIFPISVNSQQPWSQKLKLGFTSSLIAISFVVAWLSFGYSQKTAGMELVIQGNIIQAEKHFHMAQQMMPWSHTVHYEAAKGYVLLGNQTHQMKYYLDAKLELITALQQVPEEKLYQQLFNQLKNLN